MHAKKHNVDARLVLIDNASSDNTSREATKMVSDIFSHKRNEERWGFQKSVNWGVNDAFERGYDYVLVCNNDIILHPQAIWRLVERFEDPSIEVDGETLPVGLISCLDTRGEIASDILRDLNPDEKLDCPESQHPNFSAFAVSKEMWDTVGEMDEVFFPAYFEDNDLHYRMGLEGIAGICLPTAMFYHFGSATQNEAKEDGQPMVPGPAFEKNRQNYVDKWGGVPGSETFTSPYDDETKDTRSTKQNLSTA